MPTEPTPPCGWPSRSWTRDGEQPSRRWRPLSPTNAAVACSGRGLDVMCRRASTAVEGLWRTLLATLHLAYLMNQRSQFIPKHCHRLLECGLACSSHFLTVSHV